MKAESYVLAHPGNPKGEMPGLIYRWRGTETSCATRSTLRSVARRVAVLALMGPPDQLIFA